MKITKEYVTGRRTQSTEFTRDYSSNEKKM